MASSQDNEQEFDPFADPESRRRSHGGLVAWLALLLAIGLAAFEGWQWWQAQLEDPATALRASQEELAARVDGVDRRLGQIEARDPESDIREISEGLDRLGERVQSLGRELDSIRARLEEAKGSRDDLAERVESLETGMAALAARSEPPATSVELAEVEFLLRVASERLQLFGDVNAAERALELADRELEALDDPLYVPVRQDIAQARRNLSRVTRVDTLALAAGITGLQADIPDLPFPDDRSMQNPETGPEAALEQEPSGIWSRFKAALAGLVKVRRKVSEASLLSIEDRDYVRQGLWLQLESARLALMRLDGEAWQHSLRRAEDTLTEHFAADSAPAARFLKELEQLRGVELESELPDVSQPWRRLNLLRSGGGSSPSPRPADEMPATDPDGAADESGGEAGSDAE